MAHPPVQPVPGPLPLTLRPRTVWLAAFLVAVAVTLPSLGHDFVYDDVWIIAERDLVRSPGSLAELVEAPYWPAERGRALWRPGALVAFAGQWALGGGSPLLFHAVNILLYGMVAALVAALGTTVFGPRTGLAAGLLFAVHPVHVEVAANVVGQAELIPAVCYLAVLLLAWRHLRAERPAGRVWLAAGVLVATVAGMSVKEHLVTLPAAVLLIWWVDGIGRDGGFRAAARSGWPVLLAVLAPIAAYLALRGAVTGGVAAAGGLAPGLDPDDPFQRLVVMLPVSLHWLRLLFVPVDLSADYGPAHLVAQPEAGPVHLLALVVWAAILALVWQARHRLPALAAGTGLLLVTISVVSNIVVPMEILLAERLLFLPSAGWALASGGAVAYAAGRPGRRRLVLAVAGLVVVLLGVRSVVRVPVWQSNEVLFAAMWNDAPQSYRNYRREGLAAFARGDSATGERLMREAIQRNPEHTATVEELALIYAASGRYEPAVALFRAAVAADSSRPSAQLGLAIALIRTGRGLEALPVLERFVRRFGPARPATLGRIEALRVAGRHEASLALAESVLAGQPDDWFVHLMAAESALLAGRCEAARIHVDTGRPKAPEDRQPAFDRVLAVFANGDADCK